MVTPPEGLLVSVKGVPAITGEVFDAVAVMALAHCAVMAALLFMLHVPAALDPPQPQR